VYENYFVPRNEKITDMVRAHLIRSKEDGYIYSDIDIDIVVIMLSEMINSIICGKVFFDKEYSKEDIIAHTLFVYLRGMATPKAIEDYNNYIAKNATK
jgi:hypothetical protein